MALGCNALSTLLESKIYAHHNLRIVIGWPSALKRSATRGWLTRASILQTRAPNFGAEESTNSNNRSIEHPSKRLPFSKEGSHKIVTDVARSNYKKYTTARSVLRNLIKPSP